LLDYEQLGVIASLGGTNLDSDTFHETPLVRVYTKERKKSRRSPLSQVQMALRCVT
jgi:hypothetical protein